VAGYSVGVEPLPETRAALSQLSALGDADLVADLTSQAERARSVVPGLLGVSVAVLREGLTFTFVATQEVIAVLDALQYLDGGPCVQAARENNEVSLEDADALNEDAWLLFGRAGAMAGIQATLSLPITKSGQVVGSVNLYAREDHAFDGRREALAVIFGAWADGAVANADLTFSTRQQATKALATLEAIARIDNAVGVIIATQGVGAAEAKRRLEAAAALAGVPALSIAEAILTSTVNGHPS
jgi:GAF domain-containing protein